MVQHRWVGVFCGMLLAGCALAQTQLETDEKALKTHNPPLPTDGKGLLAYFGAHALEAGEASSLEGLVKKLGSDVFRERDPAAKELVKKGPKALPFLRSVVPTAPLEMKRRAEQCIREIEEKMQVIPFAAAARVLAARNEPKAAEALFNFLPTIAADPLLEEEVLTCVGKLTIDGDKVDPLIIDALNDKLSFRRMVSAYLIGRRGGAEHREKLRTLLADPDSRVRERVMQGLYGKRPAQAIEDARLSDEALLKSDKVKLDLTDAALLKYFRDQTLSDQDQKLLRDIVKQMGSSRYKLRIEASDRLKKEGPRALAFLKEVEYDQNAELAFRAREVMEEIRRASNTAVPIAAAHMLTRFPPKETSPAEAIRALLAYISFADDEAVEEEILTCLTLLSIREPGVEQALVKALSDPSPARRGAAAYVLGHVGTKAQVAQILPLLNDVQPVVRLRAAQGLLSARNKSALSSFVNLIDSLPSPYLPKVEEALYRLAEDKGPTEMIHAGSPSSRQAAVKAWQKWLQDNNDKIDLASLNDRESYLGLVTVAEYTNPVGNINGQVWESARNSGPKRFNFGGQSIIGAMDAQTLPNGRILVAENSGNRVTERDSKGNILWEYRSVGGITNPICCQRLPNGNTFIASYNMVAEIRPDKTEVYRFSPGGIFCAYKARNGHVVAITQQGQVREMKAPSGDVVNTVQVNTFNNWCSVELMPNGNYLVASMWNNGTVREIDRKGTTVWEKQFQGAFRATRMPNGNVLIASMNQRQVVEMDRSGTIRWSAKTDGQPWAVHYR